MTAYRRICIPGAAWFFTVNLVKRKNNDLLINKIDLLRDALRRAGFVTPPTMFMSFSSD